jgi:hypothetical protein
MPFPIIPAAILALGGVTTAVVVRRRKKKGMTPERKKVYIAALNSLKDPVKLRQLADAFEKEGLTKEAAMLRKRAKLRELPPKVKKQRRAAYRKAMKSKSPTAVARLAKAFQKEGATGAAASLQRYAKALATGKPVRRRSRSRGKRRPPILRRK